MIIYYVVILLVKFNINRLNFKKFICVRIICVRVKEAQNI